jgi:hypothetical protein
MTHRKQILISDVKMKQIPANTNDATTGHKLQGMSKDVIIVASWPTASMFRNCECVVLSCVRTLSALYLVKSIDIDKSFEPSDKLKKYMRCRRNGVNKTH